MRPKCHVFRRETAPYRDDLVGLAGVRIQQMLEERIAGARDILRRNGNEVVVHDMASLACAITANTTKGETGAPLEAKQKLTSYPGLVMRTSRFEEHGFQPCRKLPSLWWL